MAERARVMLVDDSVPFRWGLMEALSGEETLDIVEEASDGNEAVEKARAVKPDVIIMDLQMPNCNGVEATARIHQEMPETNILVLTISDSDSDLLSALQVGARGYLLKNEKPEMIAQAVHYVARGGIIVSPAMATKLLRGFQTPQAAHEDTPLVAVEERTPKPEPAPQEERTLGPATFELADHLAGAAGEEAQPESEQPDPASDPMVSSARLVMPPPLEPGAVLRLHQWLTGTVRADVQGVSPSLAGDTVMDVSFRDPVRIVGMLARLPFVAQIAEEPESDSGREPSAAAEESPGKALRLVLKAR